MLNTDELFRISDMKQATAEVAGTSPKRAVKAGRSQGTVDGDVRWLPVDEIYPMGLGEIHNAENPMPWFENPRDASELSDESIAELASLIAQEGQQTPVFVRPIARGYQLFDGERRLNATKLLGRDKILARVFDDIDEVEAMERAIIGETQKKTWSPLAQARAYQALQKTMQFKVDQMWSKVEVPEGNLGKVNWTAVMSMWIDEPEWLLDALDTARARRINPIISTKQIALRLGVTADKIQESLRLLSTSPTIRQSLENREIEPSKAILIDRVENPRKKNALLKEAVKNDLSANAIRQRVAASKGTKTKITVSKARISAVEPLKIAVSSLLEATRAEFKPSDREEKERLITLAERYVKQLKTGVVEDE